MRLAKNASLIAALFFTSACVPQIGEPHSGQDIVTSALTHELWLRNPELRPALSSLRYYSGRELKSFSRGSIPFNGSALCSRDEDRENPDFCIGTEIYDHPDVLARLKESLSKPCAYFVQLPEIDADADLGEESTVRATRDGDYQRRKIRVRNIRAFAGCENPRQGNIVAALHVIRNMDRLFGESNISRNGVRAERAELIAIPMGEPKR